jgi:ketosteroid isomerase-like protein
MSIAEPSHATPGRGGCRLAAVDGAGNVEVVERFIAAFDRRWPTESELDELLAPDVRFIERPNLVSPNGSERDLAAMRAGIAAGRNLFVWQRYEVRDHVANGDTVVTRMRWSGELAIDAGPWPKGTTLRAWCVGHYRLADGRIVGIEQHDCYDPVTPGD